MKKTYVCMLLDRSGSMEDIKEFAVQGYNEQVQQLKLDAEDQKDTNQYYVSLITFNGKVYEHLWNVHASELQEASLNDLECVGNTALYDAQGYAIDKLLETTNPNDKEAAYLLILITDGQNTKTMHYSLQGLKELCQSVQKKGNWTITYMGCDGEYLKEHARNTGVSAGNCAIWQNDSAGANVAFAEVRSKLGGYSKMRKSGVKACAAFHGESETLMADYSPKVDVSVEKTQTPATWMLDPTIPVHVSPGKWVPVPTILPAPAICPAPRTLDIVPGAMLATETESPLTSVFSKTNEVNFDMKIERRTCGTPVPPPPPNPKGFFGTGD